MERKTSVLPNALVATAHVSSSRTTSMRRKPLVASTCMSENLLPRIGMTNRLRHDEQVSA